MDTEGKVLGVVRSILPDGSAVIATSGHITITAAPYESSYIPTTPSVVERESEDRGDASELAVGQWCWRIGSAGSDADFAFKITALGNGWFPVRYEHHGGGACSCTLADVRPIKVGDKVLTTLGTEGKSITSTISRILPEGDYARSEPHVTLDSGKVWALLENLHLVLD